MPINIHGKMYNTVAERILAAKKELNGVQTEVLCHDPVVIKATILINGSTFTGISAANASKQIEKDSPYEVAETSAVGRALAFAGYETTNGIASAEEMRKVTSPASVKQTITPQQSTSTTSNKIYTFSLQDKDRDLATAMCDECHSHMYFNEGTSKTGKHYSNLKCELNKEHIVWYPTKEKASNWAKLNELPDIVINPEDLESLPF